MLTSCMAMAIEEERMIKVKITKLEDDLQTLRLEARRTSVGDIPQDEFVPPPPPVPR